MSWFNDLKAMATDTVKGVIPPDRQEQISKLFLNSPEMKEERENLANDELRKNQVRDYLSEMYPWETRDEERDILVEECKEAIFALSTTPNTFLGPWALPGKAVEEDELTPEELETIQAERVAALEDAKEKLAKLEPLPPLLEDFDIDTHVGLIQKLLEVDASLVEMHGSLSGGGERERLFWKNYFFHVAFTRYEAGLNVDEIWASKPVPPSQEEMAAAAEAKESPSDQKTEEDENEGEIHFESMSSEAEPEAPAVSAAYAPKEATTLSATTDSSLLTPAPLAATDLMIPASSTANSPPSPSANDYEMVDDAEMDELEAEIARELED